MKLCGTATQATDEDIIRRMRFTCWMPEVIHTHTHTHRICNMYNSSMATMVALTCLNVTLYYTACIVHSYR
jgi:hypothetical protein